MDNSMTKYKYYCQPGDYPRYELTNKFLDQTELFAAYDVLFDHFGVDSLRQVFTDDDSGEDYIDTMDRVEIIATPEEIVRRLVAWNHKDGSSLVELTVDAEKVVKSLDKAFTSN
jgi:hypothetical protein